jgi:hypothetical protein
MERVGKSRHRPSSDQIMALHCSEGKCYGTRTALMNNYAQDHKNTIGCRECACAQGKVVAAITFHYSRLL